MILFEKLFSVIHEIVVVLHSRMEMIQLKLSSNILFTFNKKFLYHVKTLQDFIQKISKHHTTSKKWKYQFAKNNPKCNFIQIAFTAPKSTRAIFSSSVLKTDPRIPDQSALYNINSAGERSFDISFTETI